MSTPKEQPRPVACDDCSDDCTCGVICDCCGCERVSDLGVVLGGIVLGIGAMSLVWALVELS